MTFYKAQLKQQVGLLQPVVIKQLETTVIPVINTVSDDVYDVIKDNVDTTTTTSSYLMLFEYDTTTVDLVVDGKVPLVPTSAKDESVATAHTTTAQDRHVDPVATTAPITCS